MISVCVCECMCGCICTYVCVCIHIYVCMYIYVCVYIYVYVYMCVCVCVYVHTYINIKFWGFPCGSYIKNPSAMQETRVQSLGWGDPLEKEKATHSSILAWEIPWTEEPGGQATVHGVAELDTT